MVTLILRAFLSLCKLTPQAETRIGMQRRRDGTFHVFVNGEDQGVAAVDVPQVSLCTKHH